MQARTTLECICKSIVVESIATYFPDVEILDPLRTRFGRHMCVNQGPCEFCSQKTLKDELGRAYDTMRSRLFNKLNKLKSVINYGVEHPWEQAEHKQSGDRGRKNHLTAWKRTTSSCRMRQNCGKSMRNNAKIISENLLKRSTLRRRSRSLRLRRHPVRLEQRQAQPRNRLMYQRNPRQEQLESFPGKQKRA